jgi:hypothetical protein
LFAQQRYAERRKGGGILTAGGKRSMRKEIHGDLLLSRASATAAIET